MTLGMVLTISIVAGVVVLLIRKYYRIFKGKVSACSCGEKNINPKSGCGCGCCGCSTEKKEN